MRPNRVVLDSRLPSYTATLVVVARDFFGWSDPIPPADSVRTFAGRLAVDVVSLSNIGLSTMLFRPMIYNVLWGHRMLTAACWNIAEREHGEGRGSII